MMGDRDGSAFIRPIHTVLYSNFVSAVYTLILWFRRRRYPRFADVTRLGPFRFRMPPKCLYTKPSSVHCDNIWTGKYVCAAASSWLALISSTVGQKPPRNCRCFASSCIFAHTHSESKITFKFVLTQIGKVHQNLSAPTEYRLRTTLVLLAGWLACLPLCASMPYTICPRLEIEKETLWIYNT